MKFFKQGGKKKLSLHRSGTFLLGMVVNAYNPSYSES
jgi:hypothetical protein